MADIIELPPREKTPPAPAGPYPTVRRCPHRKSVVSPETRKVTCKKCGKEIDPVSVLLDIAYDHDSYRRARERLKGEAEEVHARVEELKRQERNAKARLRAAQKKEPVEQERERIFGGLEVAIQRVLDQDLDDARTIFDVLGQVTHFVGGIHAKRIRRKLWQAREELRARRKRQGRRPAAKRLREEKNG